MDDIVKRSIESETRRSDAGFMNRRAMAPSSLTRSLLILAGLSLAVAALYLARGVLMPLALAVLLTFLVHPIVGWLGRRGIGRVPSVILVVVMLFAVLGGVAWVLILQFGSLRSEIPGYRDNLIQKISLVRGLGKGGALEQAQTAVADVTKELKKELGPVTTRETPMPVIVRAEPAGLWQVPSLFEGLGNAAIVLALVIFMLLEREDLRNRVLRLIGYKRLATTTRALDEAGQRISRYLLMQTIINTSFGVGVGLGLMSIGVPYALLWGVLAAVLRFIPYVGPWVAALLLIVFCLAAFTGWRQSMFAVLLLIALELVYLVLEPFFYGQSAGVSQVALLISVTFWTWLWGPVGLLLATPLTVCLAVLAKHIPEMDFVAVLIGDDPPMAPPVTYYQRLLAGDEDEAAEIVEGYLKDHPVEAVYEDIVLPALSHARRDRQRNRLSETDEQFIWQATGEIVEGMRSEPGTAATMSESGSDNVLRGDAEVSPRRITMLACPARDEADELGLRMLQQILDTARWTITVASPHLLVSEVLSLVGEIRPAVLCVGALSSSGQASHTRYLCKRLRARFPNLRIVVGHWGLAQGESAQVRAELEAAGADYTGITFMETRQHLQLIHSFDAPPISGREPSLPAVGRCQ